MPLFSLVLKGGSVDGDTPCLLFWGFVDFAILDILGFLLLSEILSDSRSKSGFSVIDMADGSDYTIRRLLPLT